MPQSSTGHVFVSYSRRDDVVMRRIVTFLRQQGIKVWVDNEKLIPGTPIWEEEIEKAIQSAPAIVVVLSPDSKNSEWVRREISLADQYRKRVFPILVHGDEETSITLRLINRQFVDIRKDEEAGLNSVSASLIHYLEELDAQEQKTKEDANRLAAQKARNEKRLAKQKAEEERLAHEKVEAEQKAEVERRAKEEAEYLAAQKAEEERLAREKAEAERKARDEADRFMSQKAEEQRIAAEKAEAERKAKKEEVERLTAQKAEEERIAAKKAEAQQKTEAERKVKEEVDRLAAQKTEEERIARTKVETERKAEEERIAREKAEAERKAKNEETELLVTQQLEKERLIKQKPEGKKIEHEAVEQAAVISEKSARPKPNPRRLILIWGIVGLCIIVIGAWGISLLAGLDGLTTVPTTEASATLKPLATAYTPPSCQNIAPATIPPATALFQPTPEFQINPEISKELQQKVFDNVVNIVEQDYVNPDYNGIDWTAIVSKYRAKIDAGLDTESFYSEMQSMILELGDENSSYQSPVDVAASEAGNNDYVGIGIRLLIQLDKNQISITSVFPDSPAEHSGLKAHDSILAVDGLPIIDNGQSYVYLIRGPECSATILTVKSPGQEPRDIKLIRQRIQSSFLIDARLVPTTDESRIGYIFIPTIYDQTIPQQMEDALNNFGPLDGLILDTRLNDIGSSSDVLLPILAFFTSDNLGQFVSRKDSIPLQISANPIQNSQDVPLIVLVSKETKYLSEIFAGVLRDSERAKIVGQTSSGNLGLGTDYDFDDGSRLWITVSTFDSSTSHANWEETGIVPDMEAYADWDTFTFETDPAVAAALTLLKNK